MIDGTEIYRENIIDRYKYPRTRGVLDAPDIQKNGVNPLCGDSLILFLRFGNDRETIMETSFTGEGCAISQVATDMLLENVRGMKRSDAAEIGEKEVYRMLAIPIGPSREKCALLALETLHEALEKYAHA